MQKVNPPISKSMTDAVMQMNTIALNNMAKEQILNALEDVYCKAINNLPEGYFEAINHCRRLHLQKGLCYAAEKLSPGAGTLVFADIHNKYKTLGYICKTAADCRDSVEIKHTLIERLRVIKSIKHAKT